MTACAMTIGMVPMALALEEGSQMQAPLGRAVIGGLVMSTFATLLLVPPIFALLVGGSVFRSPSIYPDDPDSPRFDPALNEDEEESGKPVDPIAEGPMRVVPSLFEHRDARAGLDAGIGSTAPPKPASPSGAS
jgi:hypothetical protein